MAGTAAGIAKANAARQQQEAERDLQRRREARKAFYGPNGGYAPSQYLRRRPPKDTPAESQPGAVLPLPDVAPAVEAMPDLIPVGGQAAAIQRLNDAAADAAGHLARIVRFGRVPHLIRFQAASKILDLTVGRKQSATAVQDDTRMASLLERVAGALTLRRSAANASDAAVIGEETVNPAPSVHRGRQQD